MDLYDHKPLLNEKHGEQLPNEVRQGQRLTGMSGNQTSLPLAGSGARARRSRPSGAFACVVIDALLRVTHHPLADGLLGGLAS